MNRFLLVLTLALTGCANLAIDSLDALRSRNRENISTLSVGMTGEDVTRIMGTDSAGGKLGDIFFGRMRYLQATNPYRIEDVRGADGENYQVRFYYTDVKHLDDAITDDELTPVVLLDDKIVGVGYDFLRARAPQYRADR